ncbi:tRNA (cytosine(38)-C(5))-methyltransferase [Phymastichus coffea]|uniref:tRNA (cytosine(38)-C(5))-methyltransferase n=1 Tax=Phymastichus coffea TaxID=108790 RepID=UPI00273A7606|nr:tRNA (cytosine(38)-C(5))-methyltransferase [Phymastichus coffea]
MHAHIIHEKSMIGYIAFNQSGFRLDLKIKTHSYCMSVASSAHLNFDYTLEIIVLEIFNKMRVLELFSGIGGMHYGLQESTVDSTVVMSIDINTIANKVYQYNFPGTKNISRNIESLTKEEIEKLNINCILMSPPCQPFTRVGLRKDSCDKRCLALLHILKLIPEIQNLQYILLENVKGFEKSRARDEVVDCLKKADFNYKEFILSPCQFGIPNSRHRYYLMAKKSRLKFIFNNSNLITSIPDKVCELLPSSKYKSLIRQTSDSKNEIKQFQIQYILEQNVSPNYLLPEKILTKHCGILDIRTPESKGSCCFTKAYSHYMEGTGSVLSLNTNADVKKILEELKINTDITDNKLKVLHNLKLRYFTPKEISRLMSFPETFGFPSDITNKQKYRLLGNSINVHVVGQLIYLLHLDKNLE